MDTTDRAKAASLARSLVGTIGGIKLGLEFFCANGPEGVNDLAGAGLPVFLDLKLHDIPITVARSIRALGPLNPKYVTVHAGGGAEMLSAAAAEARPLGIKLLAVTVLTSLDEPDLRALGVARSSAEQVEALATLACAAGIDGLVCAASEIEMARNVLGPEGVIAVPGLRPVGAAHGDQKRVATPLVAAQKGADILVIGRPITEAPDPVAASAAIAESLSA